MNIYPELLGHTIWPKLPLMEDSTPVKFSKRVYYPTDGYLIKLRVTERGQVRGELRLLSPTSKEKIFRDVSMPNAFFDLKNPNSFIRQSLSLLDEHIPVDGLCVNAPVSIDGRGGLFCQPDMFESALKLPEGNKKKVYLIPNFSLRIQSKESRLMEVNGAIMAARTTQKQFSISIAGKEVLEADMPKAPVMFGMQYKSGTEGFYKMMSSLVAGHCVLEDEGRSKIVIPKLRRDTFRSTVIGLHDYWEKVDKKMSVNISFNGESYKDDQLEALYSLIFPTFQKDPEPAPVIQIFL